ncbi:MAG: exodeoxyribonuclease V subunit gamma [Gracilimonas sp.]|uniref:exodeoxyribonuclease V subunit gamma n=1 Tax=Gracilimonas sp. TaxID=1974203 RepID=UPI0019AD1A27|nr:exodeoxyribonuclease V subunit gamma [Gracilimonas sp.]MBD3615835.1 exodeoxyribonuclease V subunit gamma [Gracilimonas sp.]
MFHTYHAHSLDQLAQHFSEIFATEKPKPLEPAWVIVQNNEIKEWLALKLAAHKGIAGNFRFIFPSEFLWVLYRECREGLPKVLPSDLNALQWALFNLFTQDPTLLDEIPVYDREKDRPQKRFRLCSQLADNFDQYQVYRPDMMEKWLEQKLITNNKNEQWQSVIWNHLNKEWQASPKTKNIPRRSQAFIELLGWLEEDEKLLNKIPGQIYIFGLSHAPKPFLEIISKISKTNEVHYFHRDSTVGYDSQDMGSLVEKWNKPEREQAELLRQVLKSDKVKVQKEVLSDPEVMQLPEVEIHSCHNKRREVQVLKDRILKYLDENPKSGPDDVLVMVPDAEAYAGVLETIFNNDEGEPAIPVSRLSGRNRQSAEHALAELLELLSSPFKATSVLQFMQLEPIKTRFSFSNNDLNLIEQWVYDNKVYREIGEQFNTRFSWKKGINQLISGFSMEPDSLEVYEGMIPFSGISSTEDADLVARFSSFLHCLKKAFEDTTNPKEPVQWLEVVHGYVAEFFSEAEDGNSRLHMLIDKLKQQVRFSKTQEVVTFSLIKSWLGGRLESQNSSAGRFGQGVTVSSYIPYRSVPFRFIGFLGMDEGIFPRKAVRPEFDLIYSEPQPGDRILKEDDTYLFLESLQAAGDYLHISYRGQSQRSDSFKLPSILVQQLIDVLYEGQTDSTIRHSLHPFNRRYFSADQPVSYSGSIRALSQQMSEGSRKESIDFIGSDFVLSKGDLKNKVHIHDLIDFFTHPCKYMLENELDIKNFNDFNIVSDREEFKLRGLERYKLDALLFQTLSRNESPEQVYRYADAASMIPEKLQGEKAFRIEKESIQALLEELNIRFTEEERSVKISIELEGIEINGIIGGVYGNTLVSHRVGKRKPKYEAEHWLKHLLLLEAGEDIEQSLFLSKEDVEIETLTLSSANITKNPLRELLQWFNRENELLDKVAFFVESSKKYAGKYLEDEDKADAVNAARSVWEDDQYTFSAESVDYFNHVIWRNKDPLAQNAFHENALLFWEPFLKAVSEGEDE